MGQGETGAAGTLDAHATAMCVMLRPVRAEGAREMGWRCFVALGDSFTEGIGDRVEGVPLRSWADWLTRAIRARQGALEYHNLARHGLRTAQIREEQLARALDYRPDLASVIGGANDVLGLGWDAGHFREEFAALVAALGETGATVITATMANFAAVAGGNGAGRSYRRLRERVEEANGIIRAVSAEYGTIFVDFWPLTDTLGRAAWSGDDLHPNARGYRFIAERIAAALAERSGVTLEIGAGG
jgi:lysophospholipase L1-like esterase